MSGLLPYEYSERKMSPWGGMRLIKELYDRIGMFDKLRSLPLQNHDSAIGVEHYEINYRYYRPIGYSLETDICNKTK